MGCRSNDLTPSLLLQFTDSGYPFGVLKLLLPDTRTHTHTFITVRKIMFGED